MSHRIHLIDKVASFTDCACLSELKELSRRNTLLYAINKVSFDEYTFHEWSEMLSYYFQEEIQIHSCGGLQSFLEMKNIMPEENSQVDRIAS